MTEEERQSFLDGVSRELADRVSDSDGSRIDRLVEEAHKTGLTGHARDLVRMKAKRLLKKRRS